VFNKPVNTYLSPSLLSNTQLNTLHGKLHLTSHRYKDRGNVAAACKWKWKPDFNRTIEEVYSVTVYHSKAEMSRQYKIRTAEREKCYDTSKNQGKKINTQTTSYRSNITHFLLLPTCTVRAYRPLPTYILLSLKNSLYFIANKCT